MIVKYADGKPRRTPRRSATFTYEFDGFQSSDEFLPEIDWLTGTVRPRDIDVNAVLAFLRGTPNQWSHVAVMDPDSMTHAASEMGDGPLCAACEHASCAGLEQATQDVSDVVEHGFPRPDEQRLSAKDTNVIEQTFPLPDEQRLSGDDEQEDVVEHGLPLAVEQGLPREHTQEDAVEQGLPRDYEQEDVVEQGLPLESGADALSRRPSTAGLVERGLPSPVTEQGPRPVRRRGRRQPRRSCATPSASDEAGLEVISVLVGDDTGTSPRMRDVEVAPPPRDASEITRLPGLSWKHFLHDLKQGEIEQVCMIVADSSATITAVDVNAGDPASDTRERPKSAEPKSAREARYLAQSLPALEAAGNPVAPLVREFIDIFPAKVPAELPPDRG
ncbi:Putative Polyprotein, partial [Phytophthora palmivora]